MKNFILLGVALLFGNLIFSQQETLAKLIITDARHNDRDITSVYLDAEGYISFYTDNYGRLCMANVMGKRNSQSYGVLYNGSYTETPATSQQYGYETFNFTWSYKNSYDIKEGTAQIEFVKIHKPQGVIFTLTMLIENLDVNVYRGYMEGSVDFSGFTKKERNQSSNNRVNQSPVKTQNNYPNSTTGNNRSNYSGNGLTTIDSNGCTKIPATIENLIHLVDLPIHQFLNEVSRYDYAKSTDRTKPGQVTDGKNDTNCYTSVLERKDENFDQSLIYITDEYQMYYSLKEYLKQARSNYDGMKGDFMQYSFSTKEGNKYLLFVRFEEMATIEIVKKY